ncbi:restriction endonuclease subunit S [Vibrio cholerae]|uniref:restriction endonuclease subunit S n=1 Tax=Vibrio cholerae TaxID=666 RepID=UPI002270E341|nr:restriction endonuclease subunit S [Vibrio cholerae]EGR0678615.1 restriction endonuclease subunit S [Vibrio cholerae]MCX9453250.1 restriction endonuclease subunit S [Vibrio cholerae]
MSDSKLPAGWSKKPLGALVSFQKGRKTDTSKNALNGYARYLGASGLSGKDDGFADMAGAVIAEPSDLLMLWDGERSGLVGYMQQGVVASTVSRLTPTDEIDSAYLYYKLVSLFDWIQARRTGTGVPHVPKDLGKILDIIYPKDKSVQRNIATILRTIDSQIDATQALIDKYTAIKQGMMADLFSRGIDPETKALRPTFEEAPELYHETPLGMLPKGWDVVPASTICERVIDCKNRTPPERNEGFAVIKTSNIKNGELIADSLTFTDEHSYHIWTARGVPQAGDVVITREAPVGESFLITDEMPSMCLGQRTMLYRPDPEAIQPMFMYFATRSPRFMKKLIDMAGGSTVGHVRVGDIKDMVFPKPNLSEQEHISQACLAISDKLRSEKEFLEKLISQKAGLMQDLLTGKVPV